MRKLKIGVIGLGQRGFGLLTCILLKMKEVEVVAVCDLYEDRTQAGAKATEEAYGGKRPFSSTDYRDVLNVEGLEAVLVATAWETHVEIAIAAMNKGIAVAMEVGGAYDLESLWDLVHTYERTKTPIMLMENCCFNRSELLATALVRSGKLGDIVHCHGAYAHYLAEEIAGGEQNRHYRLRNYLARNCENYPTHELGPIAKILNINRGNRMVSLVSVASRAAGMEDYINLNAEKYPELVGKKFRQGDIVNTIITCADGSTISLKLDTTLPRSYSREFTVRGTRGMYEQNCNSVYLMGEPESFNTAQYFKRVLNNAEQYEEEYLPPVWKNMTEEDMARGHGGMDGIEFMVFVNALLENKPMPIDVYDAAAWMAVTALSEDSIAAGGAPQAYPDFTDGKWLLRHPEDVVPLK